jgi:hypothetical protein
MASKSSRRKSGSSNSIDDCARLLCDGFAVDEPPEALVATGERLRTLGLVEIQWKEYVRCADPQDGDFPPKNRHCRGRIYLDDALDEAGHDFRCPECERPVFPYQYRKRRHREMRTVVSTQGVLAYVLSRLQESAEDVKELAAGVYRAEMNGRDLTVCVVDYCGDEKYLARDWARTNPTCYIVVNSKHGEERFLDEAWVARVSLAQIVCGDVDLKKRLQEVAAAGQPQVLRNASVPVYARGVPPIVEPVAAAQPERLFVVEFDEEVVRVNGETVVNRQAKPRVAVFRILWRRFVEDLLEQIPPEQFRAVSLKELKNLMEEEEKKCYDDPDTLRRVVNNLQSDIETVVKRKIGPPIGREDIVETCRMTSQADADGGYRINPFSVALRPARAR